MLREALRIRLREVLREDMGGVYGVQSFGGISRRPTEERAFTVFFGCDPANVAKLKKAVFDEIAAIQKKGVDAAIVDKIKHQRVRQHETELKENGFWARELGRAYTYGDDPREILTFQKWVDAVTSDRIKAAAKRYTSTKQYFSAVLEPASK